MKHPHYPLAKGHEPFPGSTLACRAFLGAVFTVSGFSKAIFPPEAFAAALEGYKLFPELLLMPIALVVPWVELLAGAFLLFGYFIRVSVFAVGGMVAVFLLALGSVIVRNINLAGCGCYGAYGPHFSVNQAFVFDCFLMAMVVLLIIRKEYPFSLDRWIGPKG